VFEQFKHLLLIIRSLNVVIY